MVDDFTILFQLTSILLYGVLLAKVLFFYRNFTCNSKIIIYIMFTFLAFLASIFSILLNTSNLKLVKDCYFVIFLMSFTPFQINIYNTIDYSIQNITTQDTALFQNKYKTYRVLVYCFSGFTSFLVTLFIPLFLIKVDKLFNMNLHFLLSSILLSFVCLYCFIILLITKRNKFFYTKNFCYVTLLFSLMLIQFLRKSQLAYISNIIYMIVQIATLIALCFIVFQVKDCTLYLKEKKKQ